MSRRFCLRQASPEQLLLADSGPPPMPIISNDSLFIDSLLIAAYARASMPAEAPTFSHEPARVIANCICHHLGIHRASARICLGLLLFLNSAPSFPRFAAMAARYAAAANFSYNSFAAL